MLLEKRGEMSIASAEAESPIPAAGHQQGDPVDQANATPSGMNMLSKVVFMIQEKRFGLSALQKSCLSPRQPQNAP